MNFKKKHLIVQHKNSNSMLSTEVPQLSKNSRPDVIEEDIISELIEIDHYPSRTPDHDILLLVASFKETS